MKAKRRQLLEMGVDDFVAHRFEYFLPGLFSLALVCTPFTAVGYAIDHATSFGDSTGAGIGLLVGLVVWIALLATFIATGGRAGIRARRRERRRIRRIDERRHHTARRSITDQ